MTGITKAEFLDVLPQIDRSGKMDFSLIFLESCDSGSRLLDSQTFPNIGTIIATDDTSAQSNTFS